MVDVLRYIGLGRETVFGTPVASVIDLDPDSATLDTPTGAEIYRVGGTGRSSRGRRPGFYQPSGNIVYAFDVRTIIRLLEAALGNYVFTVGTPATHEMYGGESADLPSQTVRVGKDVFEHTFVGSVISQLVLEVDGDLAKATADFVCQKDQKDALRAVSTLTLPTAEPMAFHEATAELPQATDVSVKVKKFKLSINNNLRNESRKSIGSRFIGPGIPAGMREVTFEADLYFEDTSEIERFWGNAAGPSALGSTDYPLEINFAAPEAGESLKFEMLSAHHQSVTQQATGRDEIVQSITAKAMGATHTLADAITDVETELLVTAVATEADVTA